MLDELNISLEELREDLDVLNVVNFGGGTYVLYAEIDGDRIEVDPDTYGDNFARPARLLPLEAKALVAAIDLFGDHLPQSGLSTAREKIVEALGHDPSEEGLEIAPGRDDSHGRPHRQRRDRRRTGVLELEYYKENEDEFTKREVEPYQLVNGPEGWYLGCYDLDRSGHPPLPARPDEGGDAHRARVRAPRRGRGARSPSRSGSSTARSPRAGVARVWVSPERARWLREERTVVEELADGAVVVELPYGSSEWLVREVLKGVGDLVVLEPDEARERGRSKPSPDQRDERLGAGPARDRADRRPEPRADDARRDEHLRGRAASRRLRDRPGPRRRRAPRGGARAARARAGSAASCSPTAHADHTAGRRSCSASRCSWGGVGRGDETRGGAAPCRRRPAAPEPSGAAGRAVHRRRRRRATPPTTSASSAGASASAAT